MWFVPVSQLSFCADRAARTHVITLQLHQLHPAAASAWFATSKLSFLLSFQMLEQEEKDNEAVSKMMALDQKNQLLNLFHEKNRPVLAKWPQVDSRLLAACDLCEGRNGQRL